MGPEPPARFRRRAPGSVRQLKAAIPFSYRKLPKVKGLNENFALRSETNCFALHTLPNRPAYQWRIQYLPNGVDHGERAQREPKRGSEAGAEPPASSGVSVCLVGGQGVAETESFCNFRTESGQKLRIQENLPPCLRQTVLRLHD